MQQHFIHTLQGLCINLPSVWTWKSKLRQAFSNPNAYSAFMGNFSSATGIITFLMMFFGMCM